MIGGKLIGMLGAFVATVLAAAIARWQSGWRTVFCTAAAAVALVTVHLALKAAFGITRWPLPAPFPGWPHRHWRAPPAAGCSRHCGHCGA